MPTSSGYSTASSTSTYRYSQEPYDTYSLKIVSLAQKLFGVDKIETRRLRGGSYNRIVVFTIIGAQEGHLKDGIFRIPRFNPFENKVDDPTDTSELDQVAVLQFLTQLNMPTPRLLAFDATGGNDIKSSYIVQQLATGTPLIDLYDNMDLTEKLSIVDALVGFLTQMETVKFMQTGKLVHDNTIDMPTRASNPSGISLDISAVLLRPFDAGLPRKQGSNLPDLYEFLSQQLNIHNPGDIITGFEPIWDGAREILDQMQSRSFFSNSLHTQHQKTILFHWDLAPRNILVCPKRHPDTSGQSNEWEIDKVLDWDDVYCVPPLLTREPPVWLWDLKHDESDNEGHPSLPPGYNGDCDQLDPGRYSIANGRLNADNAQIKQHFEHRFIQAMKTYYPDMDERSYYDEAYGRGRWIRRLANFLIHGVHGNETWDAFERLQKEWSAAMLDVTSPVSTSSFNSTSTNDTFYTATE